MQELKKIKYKSLLWYILSILGYVAFYDITINIRNNNASFNNNDWIQYISTAVLIAVLTIMFSIKEGKLIKQYYQILAGEKQ